MGRGSSKGKGQPPKGTGDSLIVEGGRGNPKVTDGNMARNERRVIRRRTKVIEALKVKMRSL